MHPIQNWLFKLKIPGERFLCPSSITHESRIVNVEDTDQSRKIIQNYKYVALDYSRTEFNSLYRNADRTEGREVF